MHTVFLHNSFPGHFGALASKLISRHGMRCSFIMHGTAPLTVQGINVIPSGFDNTQEFLDRRDVDMLSNLSDVRKKLRASEAFAGALDKLHSENPVDLVVGHCDWISIAGVMRRFNNVPIVSYMEQYATPGNGAMEYLADGKVIPPARRYLEDLRNMGRMYDLLESDAGWVPAAYTRSCLPPCVQADQHILTQHEGIDTEFWKRMDLAEVETLGLPDAVLQHKDKIVTYVNRGFELGKGFDVFMKAAKRIYEQDPDVHFVCVGKSKAVYNIALTEDVEQQSFKDWVLDQDDYDLGRFTFIEQLIPRQLVGLFSLSRCHVYLSVPFITGWSIMNAMSCKTPVVASDTGAVPEFVRHGDNGMLVSMTDWKQVADSVLDILNTSNHAKIADAARATMVSGYDFTVTAPVIASFLQGVLAGNRRPYPRLTT